MNDLLREDNCVGKEVPIKKKQGNAALDSEAILQPLVSVVLPFGGGPFLDQAVQSILSQTYSNLELLVVDDYSEPPATKFLKDVKDRRLRVIRSQEKIGIGKALNLGISAAKGELIARMDADDISRPSRLETQVAFLNRNPSVVACGTYVETFGNHSRIISLPRTDKWCRLMLLDSPCFAHPSVVFRRRAFFAVDGYNSEFDGAEDYEFWCRLVEHGLFANIDKPLVKYRIHAAQTTRLTAQRTRQLRREISNELIISKTIHKTALVRRLAGIWLKLLGGLTRAVFRAKSVSSRVKKLAGQKGRFSA